MHEKLKDWREIVFMRVCKGVCCVWGPDWTLTFTLSSFLLTSRSKLVIFLGRWEWLVCICRSKHVQLRCFNSEKGEHIMLSRKYTKRSCKLPLNIPQESSFALFCVWVMKYRLSRDTRYFEEEIQGEI